MLAPFLFLLSYTTECGLHATRMPPTLGSHELHVHHADRLLSG